MKTMVKRFEQALIFAIKKHKGQIRKGDGRPYVLHPISVMQRVREVKSSKNQYLIGAATLLHDVVEDCNVSLKKISKKFGYQVASIVEELTSDKEAIKIEGKANYLSRKMLSMSNYALVIKLADRLDNVADLATMNDEFRERYLTETRFILKRLEARRLSTTHEKLVNLIQKEMEVYV